MLVNHNTILTYTHEKYTLKNNLRLVLSPLTDWFLQSCDEMVENVINSRPIRYLQGEHFDNMRAAPRHIEITGFVRPLNNRLNRERIIKTVFDIGSSGILTYQNKQSKRQFDITCRVESIPDVSFDNGMMYFTINLICHSPFWRGQPTTLHMATVMKKGIFPIVIPPEKFIFGYRTNRLESVFNNEGDVTTGAIYILKASGGSITNPVVTHVGKGESMAIKIKLQNNEKIVITSMPDKVDIQYYDKEVLESSHPPKSGWQYLTDASMRKFFSLEQGENCIAYDADENVTNLSVSAEFTPLYKAVFI